MAEMTKSEMLRITNESISKLKDKTFKVYFFVLDTKGNPSGSLEYIYQTALSLKNHGYDVAMLHQEKDFIGVGDWLGEEYANLPHFNVEKSNVEIGPCDFLFIPEIFANVMIQTKKLPCKRVIIIQNYTNICEFMPPHQTPTSLGIMDAIVTTNEQVEKINEYFPDLRCHVVSPAIKSMFRNNDAPRKLVVNVLTKDQSKFNQIMKFFYWKNPMYKWISFRDLRGLPQETFCEALRESAITIWMDDETKFGYNLLEAMRCGNLVLAKTPLHLSDWMKDENGDITKSVLWFDDIEDIPMILSSIVRSWTLDMIPAEIYEEQNKLSELYTEEQQDEQIVSEYIDGLFKKRLTDFEEVLVDIENNVFKTKDE